MISKFINNITLCYFCVCLLCINHLGSVLSQLLTENACYTPNREMGTCVNINRCGAFRILLMKRPVSASSRTLLTRSQCGFDGNDAKVCCPFTVVPKGVNLPPNIDKSSEVTSHDSSDPNGVVYGPDINARFMPRDDEIYTESPPNVENHPNIKLLPTNCGFADYSYPLSGNKTGIFEFPWIALLSYKTGQTKTFQCGGTIINPRYILTAAHCVTQLNRRTLIEARVGEHNFETEEDCENKNGEFVCSPRYQDIPIEEVVFHPQFIGGARYQNDIGLVRLSQPIDMTKSNVHPVCLPTSKELRESPLEDTRMMITGWGTIEQETSSAELLKRTVQTAKNVQCGQLLNGTIQDGISYRQICDDETRCKMSCVRDSGGPLMSLTDYQYIQQGILSFGPKTRGKHGIPGVYTRVAYYMDWILDNLKP